MVRTYVRGGIWKNSEDEILKAAIMKYGKTEWARVASLLPKKSAKQCKARWQEWLDPSIKKTEWTRQEDEKLLHLAKLMPTQWRTIAPMVGRTAMQCLQRYDQLLEAAASGGAVYGASGDGSSVSDLKRLRPGEIDPTPETKPARPDAIDMDEDEKEMLSEAKARLANTTGRKAKRKAREKQLLEARRMAQLQKRRELKAAGIIKGDGKPRSGRRKKRGADEIDYNEEIPFLTPAPRGIHDTTTEDMQANNPQFKRMMADQVVGKQKAQMLAEQRKKDKKRQEKQKHADLPGKVKRLSALNDVTSQRKRGRLMLPPPMVSEEELELVAKLRKQGNAGKGSVGGMLSLGGDVDDSMSMVSSATSNLSSAISMRTSVLGGGGGMRKSLVDEARELIARTNAQTPLMAAAQLDRGNSLATNDTSAEPFIGPPSVQGGNVDPSGRKMMKLRAKKVQQELRAGFAKLPAPKFAFDVAPSAPVVGSKTGDKLEVEADKGELEEEAKRLAEQLEAEKLEKRSESLKQGLPRPDDGERAVLGETKVSGDDNATADSSEDAQSLVRQELAYIITSESAMYPVAAEDGTSTLRKRKRPAPGAANQASAKNSEMFIGARDALGYIEKAKAMVSEQVAIDFNDARVSRAELVSIFEDLDAAKRGKGNRSASDLAAHLAQLQGIIRDQSKKIEKLKKKSNVYLKGFMDRSEKALQAHEQFVKVAYRLREELAANTRLKTVEAAALPKRLSMLREELASLREEGKVLYSHAQVLA